MSYGSDRDTRMTATRDASTPEAQAREADAHIPIKSAAGWWITGLVAVAALIGFVCIATIEKEQDHLQAAREQGAPQASLAVRAPNTQPPPSRTGGAHPAADSAARTSQRAAEAAEAAANQDLRAAQAASDAGRDASATAASPQTGQ